MSCGASMDLRFDVGIAGFIDHLSALGLTHIELTEGYRAAHPEVPSPAEIGDLVRAAGMTLTFHAPFRDWNIGSFNDATVDAAVAQVCTTLDAAAAAGAGAVVVHGGEVPTRYPARVRTQAMDNAIDGLRRCAEHAASVRVPLCLENQPPVDGIERHTTTPAALAATLEAVEADLGVTLDVGHAKVAGVDWRRFVERFDGHIHVCHLSANDGTADQHAPLPEHATIVGAVGAPYNVFEMKTLDDIAACVPQPPGRR